MLKLPVKQLLVLSWTFLVIERFSLTFSSSKSKNELNEKAEDLNLQHRLLRRSKSSSSRGKKRSKKSNVMEDNVDGEEGIDDRADEPPPPPNPYPQPQYLANTALQPFTPQDMFVVGVDYSETGFAFVANLDDFIYKVENLFGDGEQSASYCNAIGCAQRYYTFASKGKQISEEEMSLTVLLGIGDRNTKILCPRSTMELTLENAVCKDEEDFEFDNVVDIFNIQYENNGIKSFQVSTCYNALQMDIICRGTANEVSEIAQAIPSNSPGWSSRPFVDQAIMMVSSDESQSFWVSGSTTLEVVDSQMSDRSTVCSTKQCVEAQALAVYLRGPNPDRVEIASDRFSSGFEFLCRIGGQKISLLPKCDGAYFTGNFESKIYGSFGRASYFECDGEAVSSIEIHCD